MAQPCAVCPKKTVLGCSICRNIFFCSTECQRLVWKSHDIICRGDKSIVEQPDLTPAERDYIVKTIGYSKSKAEAQYDEYLRWKARNGGSMTDYSELMKPARAWKWRVSQSLFTIDSEYDPAQRHDLLGSLRCQLLGKLGEQQIFLVKGFAKACYTIAQIELEITYFPPFWDLLMSAPEQVRRSKSGEWRQKWREIMNPYLRQWLVRASLRNKKQQDQSLANLAEERTKSLEARVQRDLITLQSEMKVAIWESERVAKESKSTV